VQVTHTHTQHTTRGDLFVLVCIYRSWYCCTCLVHLDVLPGIRNSSFASFMGFCALKIRFFAHIAMYEPHDFPTSWSTQFCDLLSPSSAFNDVHVGARIRGTGSAITQSFTTIRNILRRSNRFRLCWICVPLDWETGTTLDRFASVITPRDVLYYIEIKLNLEKSWTLNLFICPVKYQMLRMFDLVWNDYTSSEAHTNLHLSIIRKNISSKIECWIFSGTSHQTQSKQPFEKKKRKQESI
jgi:hypothetical protein